MVLSFIGYDRLIGSHYDQYDIMYKDFKPTANSSIFNVTDNKCVSYPGPGVTLPMAENPMFEFVGASGYDTKQHSHIVDRDFGQFKKKHDRNYEDDKEEVQRKVHFRHNHR